MEKLLPYLHKSSLQLHKPKELQLKHRENQQPEVLMLIGIMLRKPLVPRDIVWSKFATPTILAKALFLAVSYKDLAA